MRTWIRDVFRGRPLWMNVLMVFCAYMAFVYVPWDLFVKPVARDQEVWFGVLFTGWTAKILALPHWLVYLAGAYGFRRRRPWMAIWAPLYSAQVAIAMAVWAVLSLGGWTGWFVGILAAAPFVLLTLALWNARDFFRSEGASLRQRYGEWALVTGASSGIGEAFARSLATQGISCVLTARRGERLERLAAELEERNGVETRVVAIDLVAGGGVETLVESVADLDIAFLVNNAGMGCAGRFDKRDSAALDQLVQLNCAAPMALASRLLPLMRERGRGAMVVVGSIAGRQPLALHAVYAATKAFDLLLGEALYVEMKEHGVDVLVVEPGTTETEFQEIAGESPHPGESPDRVVEVSLRALGAQPSGIVGWFEWLRANLATRFVPRALTAQVTRDVMAARMPRDLH